MTLQIILICIYLFATNTFTSSVSYLLFIVNIYLRPVIVTAQIINRSTKNSYFHVLYIVTGCVITITCLRSNTQTENRSTNLWMDVLLSTRQPKFRNPISRKDKSHPPWSIPSKEAVTPRRKYRQNFISWGWARATVPSTEHPPQCEVTLASAFKRPRSRLTNRFEDRVRAQLWLLPLISPAYLQPPAVWCTMLNFMLFILLLDDIRL